MPKASEKLTTNLLSSEFKKLGENIGKTNRQRFEINSVTAWCSNGNPAIKSLSLRHN